MPPRKSRSQFIAESKAMHGETKYGYDRVDYKGANVEVEIYCNECEEYFSQRAGSHLEGYNHKKCTAKRIGIMKRKSQEKFIQEAKALHKDKYDYSEVKYEKSDIDVKIYCKVCKKYFFQTPNNHLYGHGCWDCRNKKIGDALRKTTSDFVEQAKIVHGDKYDYSLVNYTSAHEDVIIICNECELPFTQSPSSHVNQGSGCKRCAIRKLADALRKTKEQFIEQSRVVHGNDKYNYDKVEYTNTHGYVIITCNTCLSDFPQTPHHHLEGHGCSNCYKRHSRVAIQWLNFMATLEDKKIQHAENGGEYRIPKTNYRADGYCRETNEIFEFNGDYYHGNPKVYGPTFCNDVTHCTMGQLYKKTVTKQETLEELKYEVRTIWEYDWRFLIRVVKLIQRKWRRKHNKPKPKNIRKPGGKRKYRQDGEESSDNDEEEDESSEDENKNSDDEESSDIDDEKDKKTETKEPKRIDDKNHKDCKSYYDHNNISDENEKQNNTANTKNKFQTTSDLYFKSLSAPSSFTSSELSSSSFSSPSFFNSSSSSSSSSFSPNSSLSSSSSNFSLSSSPSYSSSSFFSSTSSSSLSFSSPSLSSSFSSLSSFSSSSSLSSSSLSSSSSSSSSSFDTVKSKKVKIK